MQSFQQTGDPLGKNRVLQDPLGNVQGDAQPQARLTPSPAVAERRLQGPREERLRHSRPLGPGKELFRQHESPPRVVPADQRLDVDDAAAAQVRQRLVAEVDVAAADSLPQLAHERQGALAEGALAQRIHGVAPVRPLGVVHRRIGVSRQRRPVVAVLRAERDPDRRGNDQAVSVDHEGRLQRLHDLLRHPNRVRMVPDARKQDSELVPAQASDRIHGPERAPQARADLLQEDVAGRVSQRVVDLLESVEIQHEERQRRPLPIARQNGLVETVAEKDAVGQAGQEIVERLVLEGRELDHALGHVPQDSDPVGRPRRVLGHGGELELERALRAVRPAHALFPVGPLARGEGEAVLLGRLPLAFRHRQDLERFSEGLRGGQAGQPREPAVDERDARLRRAPFGGEDDDPLDRAVDGRLEKSQGLGDPPALRHDGGQGRGRHGNHPHERLQQQERLVLRFTPERAEPPQCAEDRDGGKRQRRRGGLALAEAEGGPDQERDAKELQRIVLVLGGKERAENQSADHEEGEKKAHRLEGSLPLPEKGSPSAPEQERRSEDEIARHVSEPPRQPDRAVAAPGGARAQAKTGDADRRADRGAHHRRQEREPEDVRRPVEGSAAVGEPVDEVGARERLERVSHGDAQRGRHGSRRRHVDQEGPEEDRGPGAIPEHEQRHERDAGRRPDRARAGIDEGERQAKLARQEIHHDQGGHGGRRRRPAWLRVQDQELTSGSCNH